MAYTVLSRRYRPQTFADLVGQEHVSRTLGNALKSDRVAHAFLFTGARGVGKTTTARLLAKALNCEQGPTDTPCNACDACAEIAAGTDLDVLEIDGASNNSVDDVRRLQETLPFRPVRDRYKVVIVDEVHMLSTGAFNAFLKTLEEPPPHVKFIFATTEIHKVPVTIRSRCQRHDFRLIPQAVVADRVRVILAEEGIEADDAGIAVVAREAAGSMRDALTVLDQLLAFGNQGLRGEEVARGLGIADRSHVLGVAEHLLQHDPRGCLLAVHTLGEQGLDILHFARQLLDFVRDLVVLQVAGDSEGMVDLAEDERAAAAKLAGAHPAQELQRAFSGISMLVEEVGRASNPRVSLEMGLVRLADAPPLLPVGELIARLDAMEQRLRDGGPPPGRGPGGPGGGPGGRPGGPGGRPGGPGGRPGGPGDRPGGGQPGRPAQASPASPASPTRQATPPAQERAQERAPAHAAGPPHAQAPRGTAPGATGDRNPSAQATAPRPPAPEPTAPSTPAPAPAAEPAEPATPAPVPLDEDAPGDIPRAWLQIVETLKQQQPALGAIVEHGVSGEVSAERLEIRFPEGSFFGRQAKSPSAQQAILTVAERILGSSPKLDILFGAAPEGATVAAVEKRNRDERHQQRIDAARNHPTVRDAIDVFPEARDNVDVRVKTD